MCHTCDYMPVAAPTRSYKKHDFLDVIVSLDFKPVGPAVCESIESICPLSKPDSAHRSRK